MKDCLPPPVSYIADDDDIIIDEVGQFPGIIADDMELAIIELAIIELPDGIMAEDIQSIEDDIIEPFIADDEELVCARLGTAAAAMPPATRRAATSARFFFISAPEVGVLVRGRANNEQIGALWTEPPRETAVPSNGARFVMAGLI